MEVALTKETCDVAWMDQLPNEILLMIFRNLNFKELLQATTVCHRWNELAFFLVKNRVKFHFYLNTVRSTRRWTPNRIYRDVYFWAVNVHKDFDKACYYQMAENVKEMICIFSPTHDEGLLKYLTPFNAVETLSLNIYSIQVQKTLNPLCSFSYGLLPSLRHLTMPCIYEELVVLLARVTSKLVTLDIWEIMPRLVPKFAELSFPVLESLTLRFTAARSNGCIPTEGLIQFLTTCQHLRKLALSVDHDYSAIDVAFANPSIEDLTLAGNFFWNPSMFFQGISQLTNLRSLQLILKTKCSVYLENPLSTVESLIINGVTLFRLDDLTTVFPNLRKLDISRPGCITAHHAQLFVSTWQNTMEDLSVNINPPEASRVIAHICGLKKLRKIDITFTNFIGQDTMVALSAIAGLDTLEEMHVQGGRYSEDMEMELSRFSRKLRIFIAEYHEYDEYY